MPGSSNYDDAIREAIAAASANQGAYKRYEPYTGLTPTEQELQQRMPEAAVPADVGAIAQGILNSQGRR